MLTFPYDINHDTVDAVAGEMQEQFSLSDTDCELVASAMREVIAQQVRCVSHVLVTHCMPALATGAF